MTLFIPAQLSVQQLSWTEQRAKRRRERRGVVLLQKAALSTLSSTMKSTVVFVPYGRYCFLTHDS